MCKQLKDNNGVGQHMVQTMNRMVLERRKMKGQEKIAMFGILCFLSLFLCGCGNGALGIKGKEPISNRQKEELTAMEATTQGGTVESKLKDRVDQSKDYSSYPTTYNSWWFKRNQEHLPSGAQETIDIAKYNAVYVDPAAMAGSNLEKNIYLTFDCGYENGYTEQMLDVLKKHKAPACFFVTQTYIRDSGEIVKRMKEEGHLVGNHTVTHPNLCEASLDKIEEEVVGCQKYMKEATGYSMDPYFRPPKGEYSEYLLQVAKDLGYTTVFWSMAYLDYDVNNQPSVDHVIQHWNQYCHPGAIPLIHNVSSANAKALDQILTNLEQNGYKFKSLDQLSKK